MASEWNRKAWTPRRLEIIDNLRRVGVPDTDLAVLTGVSRQRLHEVAGPRPARRLGIADPGAAAGHR